MAKVIYIQTECNGSDLIASALPSISKLLKKGTLIKNLGMGGNYQLEAASGALSGQKFWEAAKENDVEVGGLEGNFDICVMEVAPNAQVVEEAVEKALEAYTLSTIIVVLAKGVCIFYGFGIAKGKIIEEVIPATSIAPTIVYLADLPLPAQICGSIAYQVMKDLNFKRNEIIGLHTSIASLEALMERKSRQPWDKFDCA